MSYRLGWTWWSYTSVFLRDSYVAKTSHYKSATHVILVSDWGSARGQVNKIV